MAVIVVDIDDAVSADVDALAAAAAFVVAHIDVIVDTVDMDDADIVAVLNWVS
jgi:hypothetical protein